MKFVLICQTWNHLTGTSIWFWKEFPWFVSEFANLSGYKIDMWGHPKSLTCWSGCQIFVKAWPLPDVCILICGPCVSQDVAGSMRQGHKGIQFLGRLSQPTPNIKNSRCPFISHSPIRLSTVQTPITLQTTPPPAPHAIPSSGGQQSEDGLVLDGGV